MWAWPHPSNSNQQIIVTFLGTGIPLHLPLLLRGGHTQILSHLEKKGTNLLRGTPQLYQFLTLPNISPFSGMISQVFFVSWLVWWLVGNGQLKKKTPGCFWGKFLEWFLGRVFLVTHCGRARAIWQQKQRKNQGSPMFVTRFVTKESLNQRLTQDDDDQERHSCVRSRVVMLFIVKSKSPWPFADGHNQLVADIWQISWYTGFKMNVLI